MAGPYAAAGNKFQRSIMRVMSEVRKVMQALIVLVCSSGSGVGAMSSVGTVPVEGGG